MAAPMTEKLVHVAITNIPSEFHSADLRNYFSQFIEQKGFNCFHFRHRPESRRKENDSSNTDNGVRAGEISLMPGPSQNVNNQSKSEGAQTSATSCCVVRLTEQNLARFIQMYHKKPWVDKTGEIMAARCIILKIRVSDTHSDTSDEKKDHQTKYKTRAEQKNIPPDRVVFTQNDLVKLAELQPPDIMPNGNVGTTTSLFLQYIRECRLPPKIIQKLGLTFPKSRSNKRYGTVPFDYGGDVVEGQDDDEHVITRAGHDISDDKQEEKIEERDENISGAGHGKRKQKMAHKQSTSQKQETEEDDEIQEPESGEDDDDDTCEEWERHEALHDDVTKQERNEERTFESEMEVTWDKGSSGLVFYTDAAYWKELQGDFDEQTTDDLDVDMSAYYDPDGGDKDARDLIQRRLEHRRRQGLETDSVFSKGVGQFEKYTKGIGRRVLENQGWKDGKGVGKHASGMTDALDNEGQSGRDKRGLGYYGETLKSDPGSSGSSFKRKPRKREADRQVIISTIYDDPEVNDPPESLLRSRGPYHLKYRDEVKFKRGKASDDAL